MVQPFQQEQRDQRRPTLDQQRIPAGTHKTLHFQVLFEGFEQLNDILPINNGFGAGPARDWSSERKEGWLNSQIASRVFLS